MALSFVLSGGGLKGSFQAGALKKLEEKGVHCDMIYGVSTGAINAFGYVYGTPHYLVQMWEGIEKTSDLMKPEYWKAIWMKGMYNLDPLKEWMYQYATNKTPRCIGTVSYVDLHTGKLVYVRSDQGLGAFINAVLASASQPPVITPLQGHLIDGGVREQTPLARAIDEGATKIFCMLTNPCVENITSEFKWSLPYIWSVITRSVNIMEHTAFYNDIKFCRKLNDVAGMKKIDLRMICPDRVMLDTFEVDPVKIKASIELGYKMADELLIEPVAPIEPELPEQP